MITAFISMNFLDVIDILVVAFLMYQIYLLIRGTNAIYIFVGIFVFYLLWLLVRALNMQLLSTILGQVIGVGVLAIFIVFQQEIRRFLLVVGTRYFSSRNFSIEKFFTGKYKEVNTIEIEPFAEACYNMAKRKTGALIVFAKRTDLSMYTESGDILNADYSIRLLESIFYKGSPLHDGAVIIKDNKILAARCVLPITDRRNLSSWYGMRHKAALGMSENSDSLVIIISEEKGFLSTALNGKIERNITKKRLLEILNKEINHVD